MEATRAQCARLATSINRWYLTTTTIDRGALATTAVDRGGGSASTTSGWRVPRHVLSPHLILVGGTRIAAVPNLNCKGGLPNILVTRHESLTISTYSSSPFHLLPFDIASDLLSKFHRFALEVNIKSNPAHLWSRVAHHHFFCHYFSLSRQPGDPGFAAMDPWLCVPTSRWVCPFAREFKACKGYVTANTVYHKVPYDVKSL